MDNLAYLKKLDKWNDIVMKDLISDYGSFVNCVECSLLKIIERMESQRNFFQDRNEDPITANIIIALQSSGYSASHDVMHGGHVDIMVEYNHEGDDYKWLAEAKFDNGFAHVYGGFRQLTTRYANPYSDKNNRGVMLIYVRTPSFSISDRMRDWSEDFQERIQEDEKSVELIDCEAPSGRYNCFQSRHVDKNKGCVVTVRHIPLNLVHVPLK